MQGSTMIGTVVLVMMTSTLVNGNNGGSQCPGTVCASGPSGRRCEPRFERDDKCCPVWYCEDGKGGITTHYGVSHAAGGSVVQAISTNHGHDDGKNEVDVFSGLRSMFAGMFGKK